MKNSKDTEVIKRKREVDGFIEERHHRVSNNESVAAQPKTPKLGYGSLLSHFMY